MIDVIIVFCIWLSLKMSRIGFGVWIINNIYVISLLHSGLLQYFICKQYLL